MPTRGAAGHRPDPRRDESLRRVVLEDLKREQISRRLREDLSDAYRFYLDEETRARLEKMNPASRFVRWSWWLLRSLLLRLSPARRLLLVLAMVIAVLGKQDFQWDALSLTVNWWPPTVATLVLLLMLELKDKLVARQEIEIAREVQLSLLPRCHPPLDGWSVWSQTVPANDVGGDFVDYVLLEGGRVGVVLADVAGNAMGAALLSAKLQATLRALAPGCPSLAELGRRLNETFLLDCLDNRFATLLYVEIAPGSAQARWLNAGHNAALVFRRSGEPAVERLPASSYPVGMLPEARYSEGKIELAAGDTVLLYSDGLSEARDAQSRELGEERLARFVASPPVAPRRAARPRVAGGNEPLPGRPATARRRVPGPRTADAVIVARAAARPLALASGLSLLRRPRRAGAAATCAAAARIRRSGARFARVGRAVRHPAGRIPSVRVGAPAGSRQLEPVAPLAAAERQRPEPEATVATRFSKPLLAALALTCSPALLAEDAYVPNQGSDNLTIFDIRNTADRVIRALGDQPHEAAASLDARWVFVSNRLEDSVSVFDTLTRSEVDTDGDPSNGLTRIQVGSRPHGLAVTPDNKYLFVTNDDSNDVSVVEIATFQVISTVADVGLGPHMVAVRPDGVEAWVGNIVGGDISLIEVAKAITDPANAVICVTPGGSGPDCRIPAGAGTEGIAFTRDGKTAYAANGGANTVSVLDVLSRSKRHDLPVPGSPRRVHLRPDGLRAYVSQLLGNQVIVIDTATHQLLPAETIAGVLNGLGMDFRADGKRLYVPNFFSSTVTVVNLPDTENRSTVPAGTNPDSVAVQPEEVRGLRFEADKQTLAWDTQALAERYNVYRGLVSALPDYGSCRNSDDPDLTDTAFADPELPAAGEAFSYLVSILHEGIEGILGYASSGTLREPAIPCP